MQNVSKNTLIILLMIYGFSLDSFAQKNKNNQRTTVSYPEKRWAVFHPFIAKKSYILTKEALYVADSIKNSSTLDGDIAGGQVDAFKHAYWMALLSQHIKGRKALKLGKAHEKGNYKSFKKSKRKGVVSAQNKCISDMDLWNNQQGLEIGMSLSGEPLIEIQQTIIDSIQSGKMKIIHKNRSGQFLDCEGNVIPKDRLVGQWENEKCLVPSNQKDY